MEIEPATSWFSVDGTYRLANRDTERMPQISMTPGLWDDLEWSLDGQPFEPVDRSGLAVFPLPEPLEPAQEAVIGFRYHGKLPRGVSRRGGGSMHFILPAGVVLDDFTNNFVPMVGYQEGIGIREENRYEPPEYPDDFHEEMLAPHERRASLFSTRITVTGPQEYTFNSVGVLENSQMSDGKRTVTWVIDHPVRTFNIGGGRWEVARKDGTAVFYHPDHTFNIEEMSKALAAARRYYSEWFHPYPWKELRINQFPNLSTYARTFATNIAFSEGSGFIVRSTPKTETAFVMTAHETSHQWWGNFLTPGAGPGATILSEGMANFSTILLTEQIKGPLGRMEFCRRREESYALRRRVDAERPMVKIDGRRPGDNRVVYDKGAWVSWMLMHHIGREPMLEGLREFIRRYRDGPDYPALQDYVQRPARVRARSSVL